MRECKYVRGAFDGICGHDGMELVARVEYAGVGLCDTSRVEEVLLVVENGDVVGTRSMSERLRLRSIFVLCEYIEMLIRM